MKISFQELLSVTGVGFTLLGSYFAQSPYGYGFYLSGAGALSIVGAFIWNWVTIKRRLPTIIFIGLLTISCAAIILAQFNCSSRCLR